MHIHLFTKFAGAVALAGSMSLPALALDANEAEAVVRVMEQLTVEIGEGMVIDAANIFFDYDSLGAGLIPAAGFDKQSWAVAYNAVANGYMATIPDDEFNAVFEEPLARLASSGLPEDQMAFMRAHFEGLVAEAQMARQAGMLHVPVVGRFADRLYPLFYGDLGQ